MRVAIVEDNREHLEKLVELLKSAADKHEVEVDITCFSDGLAIVDQYRPVYDIIYFDIEMKYMDGMSAAKKIRAIDSDVTIIFVTNYVQFAIEGYAVNAKDFLLKPLNSFSFAEHFKKIIDIINKKSNRTIIIKTVSGYRRINLNNLLYAENEGHSIKLCLTDAEYSIWETMKNLEANLITFDFFRCHNGYLVNLQKVDSVDKNQVLIEGKSIPISRPRKKEFMIALTNYLGK